MQFISSDTNVWIDFDIISGMSLPFLLPYTYIMFKEAIEDELLTPEGIAKKLIDFGLVGVDISSEEIQLSIEYGTKYRKLSVYDRTALAIAKKRNIKLLTGDKALRQAADDEGVIVIGTIGILDELFAKALIKKNVYKHCLEELDRHNGAKIRLPSHEIKSRLTSIQ